MAPADAGFTFQTFCFLPYCRGFSAEKGMTNRRFEMYHYRQPLLRDISVTDCYPNQEFSRDRKNLGHWRRGWAGAQFVVDHQQPVPVFLH